MTCSEYRALNEERQINALLTKGVFLTERKDSTCRYLLYQLDGFYIEIVYGLTGECTPTVNIFENIGLLEPYLDEVNIAACL